MDDYVLEYFLLLVGDGRKAVALKVLSRCLGAAVIAANKKNGVVETDQAVVGFEAIAFALFPSEAVELSLGARRMLLSQSQN